MIDKNRIYTMLTLVLTVVSMMLAASLIHRGVGVMIVLAMLPYALLAWDGSENIFISLLEFVALFALFKFAEFSDMMSDRHFSETLQFLCASFVILMEFLRWNMKLHFEQCGISASPATCS